jgi:hypothetical protein
MNVKLPDQDKRFLEESRQYWDSLQRSGVARGFNAAGMLHVMKTYFNRNYYSDLSNMQDVARLMEDLYIAYDKYLEENPPIIETRAPVVEQQDAPSLPKPRKRRARKHQS